MGRGDYGITPNVWQPAEVPPPLTGHDIGVGQSPILGNVTTTTVTEYGYPSSFSGGGGPRWKAVYDVKPNVAHTGPLTILHVTPLPYPIRPVVLACWYRTQTFATTREVAVRIGVRYKTGFGETQTTDYFTHPVTNQGTNQTIMGLAWVVTTTIWAMVGAFSPPLSAGYILSDRLIGGAIIGGQVHTLTPSFGASLGWNDGSGKPDPGDNPLETLDVTPGGGANFTSAEWTFSGRADVDAIFTLLRVRIYELRF